MFEDAMEADPVDFAAFIAKINEADALANEIAGVEATLATLQERQRKILTDELPDLMARTNTETHTTTSGRKLSIKHVIGGTWPKDADGIEAAVKWLEENNLSDLLKASVTVDFNREDRKEAKTFFEETRRTNNIAKAVEYSEAVHSSTLAAMLRERATADPPRPIPVEIFNVFEKKLAVLADPPKSRKKK